ncbi:MAG: hypothetical protein AAF639_41405 [Chloroflexota bacterium]
MLAGFGDYVQAETLTVALVQGDVPEAMAQVSFKLGDSDVTLGVEKANK